ncbi:dystrophin-like [Teleopsis dalmanni]|uniref:dystrophin-like n=1 Tax=Teleopsis dalmanni TaxID=139649 RepID=UPI0018CD5426|nr:dystrophin-like [Teleopsis dalmanni]
MPPPSRQPPPLPKKPTSTQSSAHNSAQNSPLAAVKFKEKPPPPPEKFEIKRSSNPFDPPINLGNESSTKGSVLSPVPVPVREPENHVKKNVARLSPSEDFGSEDALRGIESGLRNMERAMQEQMNLRSMEAAVVAAQNNFDLNFKAGLTGANRHIVNLRAAAYERHLSLDESRDVGSAAAAARQSFEELKQLRTQQLQNVAANNAAEHSMRPTIEHHMRSLDRNLPLELQYSRHRVQAQAAQEFGKPNPNAMGMPGSGSGVAGGQQNQPVPLSSEFREHIRQQLLGNIPGNVMHNTGQTPGSAAAAALLQHQAQSRAAAAAAAAAAQATGGLTREEMRMRRRSSHDETQLAQNAAPGLPGKGKNSFIKTFPNTVVSE